VHELVVDGRPRSYRLYTPVLVDRRHGAPLVVVLHGATGTAEITERLTGFDGEAGRAGFLVAYPDGVEKTWNAGSCCGGAVAAGVDDVAFLRRVEDDLVARSPVDPSLVFFVGVSNGGMMAHRMACEASGRVAGVASVAGTMAFDPCRPTTAVPVLDVHGTADAVVPYGGGPLGAPGLLATASSPPAPAAPRRWAALDRCPRGPSRAARGRVSTITWAGCTAGTAVRLVTVAGAGHTWFARRLGPVDGAVDATAMISAFFGLR
jgi:polyhydroxybutyrate depolymerase